MSARVEKLKALLSRVEQRRQQPRLQAVPAAFAPAQPSNEASNDDEVSFATVPPPAPVAAAPARAPAKSPLADAIAEFAPPGGILPTPVPTGLDRSRELHFEDTEPGSVAPSPFRSRQPPRTSEPARPPEPPVRSRPPTPAPAPVAADPFANDPFGASQRPPAPSFATPTPTPSSTTITLPPAPATVAPPGSPAAMALGEPLVPLTAPSARISADLPLNTAPVVTAVSPLRVETKRSFGELIERSLGLRPRE